MIGSNNVERVELSDSVTIYRGDCLEVLPTLSRVDAVVTDPPYGMDWDTDTSRFSGGLLPRNPEHSRGKAWDRRVIGDCAPFDPSHLLNYARVVLFGCNHYAQRLPVGTTLVWVKRRAAAFGSFLSDAELAWMKGGRGVYCRRDLSLQGESKDRLHPAQKPIGIMAWCMDRAKVAGGETVVDPYMGSGTTGVACIRTGRGFIGIEIGEADFKIARKRLEGELAQGRLF